MKQVIHASRHPIWLNSSATNTALQLTVTKTGIRKGGLSHMYSSLQHLDSEAHAYMVHTRESGNHVGRNRADKHSHSFLVMQPVRLHQHTVPVQPVHLHALTITRELSHTSKPQPSTCKTRACTNIPVQPVCVNLPTWFSVAPNTRQAGLSQWYGR